MTSYYLVTLEMCGSNTEIECIVLLTDIYAKNLDKKKETAESGCCGQSQCIVCVGSGLSFLSIEQISSKREINREIFNEYTKRVRAEETDVEKFKVVIAGDGETGKSKLVHDIQSILKLPTKSYKEYTPTMGVDVYQIPLTVMTSEGEKLIELSLYDTADQERYGGLRDGYFIGAKAAVITFNSMSSYKEVPQFKKSVTRAAGPIPITVVQIGNKSKQNYLLRDMIIRGKNDVRELLTTLVQEVLKDDSVEIIFPSNNVICAVDCVGIQDTSMELSIKLSIGDKSLVEMVLSLNGSIAESGQFEIGSIVMKSENGIENLTEDMFDDSLICNTIREKFDGTVLDGQEQDVEEFMLNQIL
jgi:GTPase SAR1 family protein